MDFSTERSRFKNQVVDAVATIEEPKAVIAPETVSKAPVSDCSLVDGYDWDTQIMFAICMAESHGNPLAVGYNTNGTNDKGLLQINSIHVDSGLIGDNERFDPQKNVAAAYAIYKGSGYSAWSSYNSGIYLKYL